MDPCALEMAKIAQRFFFELVPGHEIVGTISAIGKSVEGFSIGDRCVADPTILVWEQKMNLKCSAYVTVVRNLFLLSAWPVIAMRELPKLGRKPSWRVCGICGRVSLFFDLLAECMPISSQSKQESV